MLENFLTGDELDAVLAEVKQLPAGRGRHARSAVVRSLMAHEKILPLVVDCAGWNIQCRECILSKAGPMAGAASPIGQNISCLVKVALAVCKSCRWKTSTGHRSSMTAAALWPP